jgi:serine/threonine protein phosphatase PrpC
MLRATQITCKTDTGRQRRDNEDSAFARAPLFVVADGMGGAQAGEVASRIAIETFEHDLPDGLAPEQGLAERVREANRRIYDSAREERERAGMGTTLTAAYLEDQSLAIAHVGDSRAYMLRDGSLQRLTRDHSLVDELVRRGKLTEEQAAEHPQRSIITRALGPEPEVEVDTWSYPVRPGDVLLLCSDGLTSMLSEDQVAGILTHASTLEQAGNELIAAANAAGGRDNITVVLFEVEDAGGPGSELEHTMVDVPAPRVDTSDPDTLTGVEATGTGAAATATAPVRMRPVPTTRPPLAGHGLPRADAGRRRRARFAKPVAALVAIVVVLGLIGGGGYLASRQLYFIGTNPQGVVTIYRGLPYDLPAGIRLYETYYVSGVPASLIPVDRRSALLDNRLRSQSDASNLIRQLELGRISR